MKNSDIILLDHGSGGKLSHELISGKIIPLFANSELSKLDDGAVFEIDKAKIAFSTDSYTVDPIFFPGGNIGDLAVNGTINDIAMCGASPLFLSAALIIEEGFSVSDLEKILNSMNKAAKKASVKIVTGDTKVVEKGSADKIFINTSGVGRVFDGVNICSANARVGDKIILSGYIADHGITILTKRKELAVETDLKSDSAALNKMVEEMISVCRDIHVMRDPTRGGLGTALSEIAVQSKTGIKIYEDRIPIRKETAGVCDLLGIDPLYMANEGKLIAFAEDKYAEELLEVMQKNEFGKEAAIIGEVVEENKGKVIMQTPIGGERIIDMLVGSQVPRIC